MQYPFWHFKMIYLYALATIVYDASRAKTLPTNALILFMLPFLDTQSLSLLPFLVLLPFSPLHLCSPPSFFPPFLPPHPICLSLLCVVLSFGNVGSHRGLLLWWGIWGSRYICAYLYISMSLSWLMLIWWKCLGILESVCHFCSY